MGSFCRNFVFLSVVTCALLGCGSGPDNSAVAEDDGGSTSESDAGGGGDGGAGGALMDVAVNGGAGGMARGGAGGGNGGDGGTVMTGGTGGVGGAGKAASGALMFIWAESNSSIEWTCDGRMWKRANMTNEQPSGFRFVDQAGGLLIAAGGGNETGSDVIKVHTSEDGVNWTPRLTGRGNWMSAAGVVETATGPVWVVAGGNGERRYSRDRGVTWSKPSSGPCTTRFMASGGGRAVAICDEGTAILKPSTGAEPVQWVFQGGIGDGWGRVAYGNGRFVAVWGRSTGRPGCKVLVDGSDTWQACGKSEADFVIFDGSWFYVSTNVDGAHWSQDGLTWVKRPEPAWRGSPGPIAGADNIYVRRDGWQVIAARVPAGVCF